MNHLLTVPDLAVPEAEILRRANGSTSDALKLAAAFGYGVACRDLDRIMGQTHPESLGHD